MAGLTSAAASRLRSGVRVRGVQARGERRTEPDEDAADFALKSGIVGGKLPGREVCAERGERVTGFERGAALDEPCGERPLGAAGNRRAPSTASPRIVPPPLVPGRARHPLSTYSGAWVARVLSKTSVASRTALPSGAPPPGRTCTPVSEGADWASAWRDEIAVLNAPRRAASTAASRVWAATAADTADEQARGHEERRGKGHEHAKFGCGVVREGFPATRNEPGVPACLHGTTARRRQSWPPNPVTVTACRRRWLESRRVGRQSTGQADCIVRLS